MKKTVDKKTLTTQIITDSWLGSFLSYLPNPDDIVSGTWESYSTYRRMMTDPRIKSLMNKKKTASLTFPASFVKGSCRDDVFEFVRGLPLFKNLYRKEKRMLSALNYGFSVSEIVWALDGGRYVPENIITRKPERFQYDDAWNLYWVGCGKRMRLDQPFKWLQMQHDPDDENPYGTSELRSVYWPWMFKNAGYEFWLQATEKFSVNSIVALFDAEGDENAVRSRARDIADMLMGVSSGSTAAVANTRELKEIGMSGKLSDFNTLVEACDTQISYGLTGQSIATSNTNGGSLALGEVQADMLWEDCRGIALEVQSAVQKLVNWTVELNFGEGVEAPQYLFDIDRKASFEKVMQAVDRGIPVSRNALYDSYGLPRPSGEDDSFVRETGGMMLSDSDHPKSVKKNFQFF